MAWKIKGKDAAGGRDLAVKDGFEIRLLEEFPWITVVVGDFLSLQSEGPGGQSQCRRR
jgi:hypothetical protein